jgi:hypothetical protein
MIPSAKDVERALRPKELIFGLTIRNMPTINLRDQYAHDREAVFAGGFGDRLHAWRFGRADGPATVTYPEPNAYFTMLLRATIVGVECTIQSSAIEELLFSNRLTEPLRQAIRNPPRRAMADAYYNKMPEYVNAGARLKTYNPGLWKEVIQFYREVRNPISHGYELGDVKAESLRMVFHMFYQINSWIDSWSDRYRVQRILASTTFQMLK